MAISKNNQLLSITQVCSLINRDRRSLWRWVTEGRFPQPLRLNGRTLGWRQETYQEWLESLEGGNEHK